MASAAPTEELREMLALTPPVAQIVSYAVRDSDSPDWAAWLGIQMSPEPEAMAEIFGPVLPQAALSYRIMALHAPGVLWAMPDEAAAEALPPYLARHGFAQDGAVWRRGTYLEMDFSAMDPTNPFIGAMGQGNAVFARGRVAAQVFDGASEQVIPAMPPEMSQLHLPGMQTALAGLDAIEGASLRMALVLMPGTELGDPAVAMGMREAQPGAGEGAQGWTRAIVAQISQEAGPVTALSVGFPDCAAAEAGGQQIAAIWAQLPENGDSVSTLPVTEATEGCAAIVISDAPNAVRAVYSRAMARDFTPLSGATP
ncbi:MAG: hypothetical protein Q4G25_05185 [Paracoccus sp. (in: a-proteobacteria)]|nr:hypothetical protein [Paracoccus sp. (in: a-proteobacteria)]